MRGGQYHPTTWGGGTLGGVGGAGVDRPVAGGELLVANRKLHAQQVGCPSKISTMLAFNIITNSMPNRRFPPHTSRRAERRNDTWQVEPGGVGGEQGLSRSFSKWKFHLKVKVSLYKPESWVITLGISFPLTCLWFLVSRNPKKWLRSMCTTP